MKSIIALFTSLIALISAITCGISMSRKSVYERTSETVKAAENSGITTTDRFVKYQTINGFGCSGAWWAQVAGEWENLDDIVALLYDKNDGIGLNIYRYNLGAGSIDDDNMYEKMKRTESFLADDGTLDFTQDAAAQKVLAAIKDTAGKMLRVTLFSNSAPVQYTINGKAYTLPTLNENGESVKTTNLSADKYDEFADYVYDCAAYFVKAGYRVTGVSPVNEPQYSWQAWYNGDGSVSMNQEGCYFTAEETRDLYSAFVSRFNHSMLDIKGVKVEMFESGEAEPGDCPAGIYLDTILADKTLSRYFDSVSTHSYWSDTNKKTWSSWFLKDYHPDLKVACTEYCQMANDRSTGVYDKIQSEGMSSGLGIEYGVAMAKVIVDDMTILNATEWDWWLGCAFGGYTDGLIYLNRDNHSDIETSKRLWCLGNFSKFTCDGSVRIAATSGNENLPCVAYLNPDNTITVVYVNATDEDITTAYETNRQTSFFLTDATHDLEQVDYNTADITVPAQSVLTMVVENGSIHC